MTTLFLLQIVEFSTHVVSFVQVRGSVPLYWSQTGMKYKPPPRLEKCESYYFSPTPLISVRVARSIASGWFPIPDLIEGIIYPNALFIYSVGSKHGGLLNAHESARDVTLASGRRDVVGFARKREASCGFVPSAHRQT